MSERDELLEALQKIAGITVEGPHVSAKGGMEAFMSALYHAQKIANTAIAKATGEDA